MNSEFFVAAAHTFYPAVLVLPVRSPGHGRNAEPSCSAAASARSDRTAKQRRKQGSLQQARNRAALCSSSWRWAVEQMLGYADCHWLNLTLWLSILASLLSCFLVWLWWSNQFRLQTVKSVPSLDCSLPPMGGDTGQRHSRCASLT